MSGHNKLNAPFRCNLVNVARSLLVFLCSVLVLGVGSLVTVGNSNSHKTQTTLRFQLDPGQSKFVAHALAGGLLWFKGHNHLVAARDFAGVAEITPNSITPASLELRVKSDSLVETSDVFTEPQKQIINKELRDIVLHPDKYPEIVFQSTDVTGKLNGSEYDLKIGGNLTLHGVTRRIVIPAKVTLTGNDLRSVGEFDVNREDFGVKATSAFHGLVRVKGRIHFTFDIVGHRI
jgi:polyisoprenoid-binding protein YceI